MDNLTGKETERNFTLKSQSNNVTESNLLQDHGHGHEGGHGGGHGGHGGHDGEGYGSGHEHGHGDMHSDSHGELGCASRHMHGTQALEQTRTCIFIIQACLCVLLP
jgi:hypothetical protein